jgi:hypothetical protein
MKELILNVPTFAFVVGTRAALGVGVGLLLAERLSASRRRAIGGALVAIGAATTVPALMSVRRSLRPARRRAGAIEQSAELIGAARYPRKGDDAW